MIMDYLEILETHVNIKELIKTIREEWDETKEMSDKELMKYFFTLAEMDWGNDR